MFYILCDDVIVVLGAMMRIGRLDALTLGE
jgi:hypothetical protein